MDFCRFSAEEETGVTKLKQWYFFQTPLTSAQGKFGTEKKADAAIIIKYDDDNYFQGYGQIKGAFKALTKDDILKPYISDQIF